MDIDIHERRGSAGFPVDQPIEALKTDHHIVKQLFDHYMNTQDMNVKKQAGPQAVLLVEMHSRLEESVFYPQVHEVDSTLVDNCENEHQQVDDMIARLKSMDAGDAQYDQLFRQMATAVLRHIDTEEQQLFPKVMQANLDMSALGAQMQMFESNMLATQARESDRPGMRP